MIIKNVQVYTEEGVFRPGTVWVKGDRIEQVWIEEHQAWIKAEDGQEDACLDGAGSYLIPGMIDIHTHGAKGYDFCDGTLEAVGAIAEYLASVGVTTFAPATMTLPVERLEQVLRIGAQFVEERQKGKWQGYADLAGINMEGPFISRVKRGAQNQTHILPASVEIFERFQYAARGLVKYIGIAPEEGKVADFIRRVQGRVKVSIAHSNADYEKAREVFDMGVGHVTHLYNAMSEFNHREPGIVGAVADCGQVEAELICDGVHIHPAVIRGTFAMLGAGRIIMISDNMRATGMPEGSYELGGQQVKVQGKQALLENGTIAGSITPLSECFRYTVKNVGIPLEAAVACVTVNPARSLGIDKDYGTIAVGKKADLVLLDKYLEVRMVLKDGRLLK